MRTSWLWLARHGAEATPGAQRALVEPVLVTPAGVRAAGSGSTRELLLVPVDAPGGPCGWLNALLLVPAERATPDAPVRLDGACVGAGMHPLHHGQRLECVGHVLWLATRCTVEEVPYDPALLGPERHCFRVKAKLKPGEPVVACPGVPQAPCGVVYKAAAWRSARVCAQCGHDTAAPAWAPPARAEGRSLRELFTRAAARRA